MDDTKLGSADGPPGRERLGGERGDGAHAGVRREVAGHRGLTHASFFSGVGGLDLGLERAGWRTVSFSEVDPYASAVLAERWPVPNLGDITRLANGEHNGLPGRQRGADWTRAHLWSGGFPCQDLSVAGKRRGLAGARSGLAFAFLGLVERHRPPYILLENVPGLLSSHGGRDMARLLGEMVELGYGVAYRVLDARHFGVPQRRRRVFVVGVKADGRAGAERAAAILAVGTRCRRHPATGHETGQEPTPGAGDVPPLHSNEYVGPIDGAMGHHGVATPQQSVNMGHIRDVAAILNSGGNDGGFRTEPGEHLVSGPIRTGNRLTRQELDDIPIIGPSSDPGGVRKTYGLPRRLDDREPVAPTLNAFDVGDTRTTAAVLGTGAADDDLLPPGLDSHRYRCCGNGVVSNVAEWLGWRIRQDVER